MSFLQRVTKGPSREKRGKKYEELVLRITGASLPSGTATSAPFTDGLGKQLAVATDGGGSNVVITFNEKLPGIPVLKSYVTDGNTYLSSITPSATGLTYTSSSADLDATITLLVPRPAYY